MGAPFNLEAISAAFSDAALDPSCWATAMDAVSEATHSYGAILFDAKNHLPGIPRSRRMEPSFEAYVSKGWIDRDVRYQIAPVLAQRSTASDFDILSPDQISRHPYYQEFLAPFGLRWFAGVRVSAGDDFWCLSIQRSIVQGPFDQNELLQLAGLSKQLATAVAIANAVGFVRAEAALDAFCASDTPVAMIARNGTVIAMNGPAERLLDQDLRVMAGHLVSSDRRANDTFSRGLNEMMRNSGSAMIPPIQMPRPQSGRRPLLVYLLRLPKVTHNALSSCQVAAVFIDPDLRPRPAETVMMSCYGLTKAEAKLAGMLAGGDCLTTVADHLCITYETARNQLKAVFAKMEIHRQSELMALLSRFPAAA